MSKTAVLTDKQEEFYNEFIRLAFLPGRINWPTTREMMAACDLSSTSEANRYFNILVARGFLTQDEARAQYRLVGWKYEITLVRTTSEGMELQDIEADNQVHYSGNTEGENE